MGNEEMEGGREGVAYEREGCGRWENRKFDQLKRKEKIDAIRWEM